MILLFRSDKRMVLGIKILFLVFLLLLVTGCSVLPGDKKAKTEAVTQNQQQNEQNNSGERGEVNSLVNQPSKIDSSPIYSANKWSSEAKKSFINAVQYLGKAPDKAVKGLYKAIAMAPTMEPAYFDIAKVAYQQNKAEMLNNVMKKAQENNIRSARLFTAFALGLRQQSKFDEAKSLYSRAIKLNNSYLPAILNMAILEDVYMGHLKKAETFYLNYKQQLQAQGKTDKRLKNWLTDLQQRLKKQQKGAGR